MSHLENNYFLESLRQADWFDVFESDIQALLIFDPLITLWGNFDAPYLKLLNDARVASACFYVRTCRRVRNSKKIATIRDFHLPGSFLCLSTRLVLPLWFVITECAYLIQHLHFCSDWLITKKSKYPEFCMGYIDETWYVGSDGHKY